MASHKRLSDTRAVVRMPAPEGEPESLSVSIRQIENGFIRSESRTTSTGYSCREEYSPTRPTLEPRSDVERSARTDALSRAIGVIPEYSRDKR